MRALLYSLFISRVDELQVYCNTLSSDCKRSKSRRLLNTKRVLVCKNLASTCKLVENSDIPMRSSFSLVLTYIFE